MAGIGPKQGPPGMPPAWTTYLASDDLDDTVSKIKAAGGQTIMEPMDVMDVGRMAVAADPGGAFFGVWQARGTPGSAWPTSPARCAGTRTSAGPTTRTRPSTRPCSVMSTAI